MREIVHGRPLKSGFALLRAQGHFGNFFFIPENFLDLLIALKVPLSAIDFQISPLPEFVSGFCSCRLLGELHDWGI